MVALATKAATFANTSITIAGLESMRAVLPTMMYSLRNFVVRESVGLIVGQVEVGLQTPPNLRKRGRARVFTTQAARQKAYLYRKRSKNDGSAEPADPVDTAGTALVMVDMFANIYDTTLAIVNWSIANKGSLGVFVTGPVSKGTKLTAVAPPGWACPISLHSVSALMQLGGQEGNATVVDKWVVACIDLPAGTEVLLL
jgi:hypothetical protein